jgi:hypothetical protein
LDSKTLLSRVDITSSRELAVFVRKGTLGLMGLKVSNVASSGDTLLGDAIHARDGAVVRGGPGALSFSDLGGSGVFVSSWAEFNVPSLVVERARSSAIFVEYGGQATIGALLVRGGKGPAIVVPDRASVSVETLSVAGGTEMPVYAECAAGAKVILGHLESTVAQLPSQCVTIH